MRLERERHTKGELHTCSKCGHIIPPDEAFVSKPYGVYHRDCFFRICSYPKRRVYGEDLDD